MFENFFCECTNVQIMQLELQDPVYLTSMLISPFFSQTTYSELQFDIKKILKCRVLIQYTVLHLVIIDVQKHFKRL